MKIKLSLLVCLAALALWPGNAFPQNLPGRYHRYIELRSALVTLRNAHPDIVKLDTVGVSTRLGIPILRLKISSIPHIDQDKPAAFICGGAHANEVLGPEVVLGFAQDLLQRYSQGDTLVARLINSLEIFLIPMINPEGHVVVENGNLDWRKNQCDNDSNGIFNFHDGVDNNRNYDLGWELANDPKSTTPESSMFRGTAPFTQSENVAMRDFAMRYRPTVALDYHSPAYGLSEVAYYPWYWRTSDGGNGAAPDEALMFDIARQFASLIINDQGDSTYRARRSLVEEGDLNTYFYGNFGTAVFTVEVSDTTIQQPDMVDGIVARNLPAIYYLLDRVFGGRITGVVRDSVTMEPLEAEVTVLERTNPDINPRLSRPDNGRYNRIMGPGTYTLRFMKSGYYTRLIGGVTVGNAPVTNDVLLSPLNPRPPAPTLQYPPDGELMNQGLFTFDWSDVGLATHYWIEIATDSAFSNIVRLDSNVTSSQYRPPAPLANGRYFWHVRGGNANGWGPYAPAFDFTVDAHTSIDDQRLPAEFSLGQNYPNPFNAQTTIEYGLPQASYVTLDIYDIMGRYVEPLIAANQGAGIHDVIISAANQSSGIYFYRLEACGLTATRKMLLLK